MKDRGKLVNSEWNEQKATIVFVTYMISTKSTFVPTQGNFTDLIHKLYNTTPDESHFYLLLQKFMPENNNQITA